MHANQTTTIGGSQAAYEQQMKAAAVITDRSQLGLAPAPIPTAINDMIRMMLERAYDATGHATSIADSVFGFQSDPNNVAIAAKQADDISIYSLLHRLMAEQDTLKQQLNRFNGRL